MTHARLLLLLALTACSLPWRHHANEAAPSSVAQVDERIRGLVHLKGEYWFGDGVYSLGDNEYPLRAIAAADTMAIRSLVRCLSDDRLSRITLRGRRVTVGRLCADALIGTPYVQAGGQHHGFPEGWRGVPSLAADSLDLGPVQRAWFQWLHEHQLSWPKPPGYTPPCPAPGSNTIEQPKPRATPLARVNADGHVTLHLYEDFPHYRFSTFVIDSEFVILTDSRADSAQWPLQGLSPNDIESLIILKPEDEAWKWRACEGVPLVLIMTRSKRWRPRPSR
jgi:hypothetical protein